MYYHKIRRIVIFNIKNINKGKDEIMKDLIYDIAIYIISTLVLSYFYKVDWTLVIVSICAISIHRLVRNYKKNQ